MFKKNITHLENSLTGKILIANPYCTFGDIFEKAIIYVMLNSKEGSLGLILNKYISHVDIKSLSKKPENEVKPKNVPILIGGPLNPDKVFVIHSDDYLENVSFNSNLGIAVTSNNRIIDDILDDKGPKKYSIILGYTGWKSGELENEILNNYWEIDEFDKEIIFSEIYSTKWNDSIKKLGIRYSNFSSLAARG